MKDGINILGDFEDGLDGDGGTHGVEHEDGSVFTGKTAIAIHYLSVFDFDLNIPTYKKALCLLVERGLPCLPNISRTNMATRTMLVIAIMAIRWRMCMKSLALNGS